ncbi:MAG TPA: trigger factor [Candidatus Andersenbacteria bacterium]|nr:trigger factor [Candidatus Andersenbacteria bacterium]
MEITFTVSVPNADFIPFVKRSVAKLAEQVSIKGFRPGKAPQKLVIESVGLDRVLHEAMDEAIPYFFAKEAIEKDLQVVNRPSISVEEIGLNTPFRFTATVEVVPEITLADPQKLGVEKRDVSATEDQVNQELKHLAKMRGTLSEVGREAKLSDIATIDFQVKIDGNTIDGGESKNHPVPIGEGRFVSGFEEGLIGAKAGDNKTFPIKFPEDYGKNELQGKQAEVTVHVHSIQERNTPELNDEFAKTVGKFESLTALKEELRKNITDELIAKEQERYLGELAESLMEKSTFGVIPSSLIEHEIDRRMEEFTNMLAYQQKTIEQYMVEHNTTLQSMRDTMKESAEKQVRIGLALRKLAKEHNVTVTEKEITEEANKQLEHFATADHAHEEVDPDDLREYVASTLRNTKTLDLLNTLANK